VLQLESSYKVDEGKNGFNFVNIGENIEVGFKANYTYLIDVFVISPIFIGTYAYVSYVRHC